jgi:MraZ protein
LGKIGEYRGYLVKQASKSTIQDDENFFFGEFEHSLDPQRRVAIPSNWRKEKKPTFFLLPGRHKALHLIPFGTFRETLMKLRKISFADPAASLAFARLGASGQECECDKQGRIQIPQKLIEQSELKGQVVMVGALTTIQIWSKENWSMFQKSDQNDVLDVIQKIEERPDNLLDVLKGLK